jgi:UDP-N-acetylmuramoyl-L-alanyl-D-glutamate--2,6-diaminopimelate ligase
MHSFDSRKIKPGDTFICLPEGAAYIQDALKNGALNVVSMTRAEMAVFSCDLFDNPSEKLTVIGVTGTNGKTTVSSLIHQFLLSKGFKSKLLGTINSELTTPESLDIQASMKQHIDAGGTHFVMEVSSHGIVQHRVAGIQFSYKVLTNISQDHLDFHKDMPTYRAVKFSFMNDWPGDSIFPKAYKRLNVPNLSYLQGQFNVENVQAAKAVLLSLNFSEDACDSFFTEAKAPKGRFESIENNKHLLVIVDFAHTPDALENVLKEAQKIAKKKKGRVLSLFGCGGNRDIGKRSLMAAVAEKRSAFVVVTADNPRFENQSLIFDDIRKGFNSLDHVLECEDRKEAISFLLNYARDGDVVVVAGKGHETYQIIGDKKIPFDDGQIIKEWFSENID